MLKECFIRLVPYLSSHQMEGVSSQQGMTVGMMGGNNVRERERARETDRQTDRQTDEQTKRRMKKMENGLCRLACPRTRFRLITGGMCDILVPNAHSAHFTGVHIVMSHF